jgi:hypothetical protein
MAEYPGGLFLNQYHVNSHLSGNHQHPRIATRAAGYPSPRTGNPLFEAPVSKIPLGEYTASGRAS